MTTDTNNFGNSVFPTTLEMASQLLEAGVKRDDIISHIYHCHRVNRLRAMGYLLDNMEITPQGVAIVTLSQKELSKFSLLEGETEGFVNLPLAIKKVRLSIFVKEAPDRLRVSLRSKKGTSANQAAKEYFNGGGHILASGGRLSIGKEVESFDDVRPYIRKFSCEFFAPQK